MPTRVTLSSQSTFYLVLYLVFIVPGKTINGPWRLGLVSGNDGDQPIRPLNSSPATVMSAGEPYRVQGEKKKKSLILAQKKNCSISHQAPWGVGVFAKIF